MSVANYSASAVARRLQILSDGSPVTARDIALQPLSRADVVIDELPAGAKVVEARISPAATTGESSGPPDYLATDDASWAIVPPDRLRRVLLVGPTSAGMSSERIAVIRARDLVRVGEGGGVDGEDITVHAIPRTEAPAWLARKQAEGYELDLKLWGMLWMAEREPDGRPIDGTR